MIQSLHIFRKDVRHLWPELSLYAVLLIAFAWTAPQDWLGGTFNPLLQILMVLLRALLPILWLVMIARLIQDESLVGDQQFWITRPYSRVSLLVAKIIFIAVGVILPFALMQVYLLLRGGLHPAADMSGLLLNLLYLTLLCWLPFAAVASVTATLPRMAMSLVAAVIAIIVVLVLVGRSLGLRLEPPFIVQVLGTIFAVLLIAVLLCQYVLRNTKYSRIALIATPVLLIAVFLAYPTGILIPHRYAAAANSSEQLVFDADPAHQPSTTGKAVTFASWYVVSIPAKLQGFDPRGRLSESGLSYILDDSSGHHYTSPWIPADSSPNNPLRLFIPKDVIERAHGGNVHLHLTFVADRLSPGSPETITTASSFDIPGKGSCFFADDDSGRVICRYPYHGLPPTRVTGTVSTPPCGSSDLTDPGVLEILSNPQVPSFDPVLSQPLNMGGTVCPGTPLTFTVYQPAGALRVELDIPAIPIDRYIMHIDLAARDSRRQDQGQGQGQGMPPTAPPPPPASGVPPNARPSAAAR